MNSLILNGDVLPQCSTYRKGEIPNYALWSERPDKLGVNGKRLCPRIKS
ncbi:hypothetical protein EMGBS15_16560 [Filimonas sp.]|nr:hypothetical protein EMGBS15_16560 [Filimonas sp.]